MPETPQLNTSFYDDDFNFEAFSKIAKIAKRRSPIERILCDEFAGLSNRLDRSQIQDSCSVRNVLRSRRLAKRLITDEGILDKDLLEEAIQICEKHLYFFGPERELDAYRQEHLLRCLKNLSTDETLVKHLHKISRPFFNRQADDLIRDSLGLKATHVLKDTHARRAALSAYFTYLRQSVGSCFATAPAIIIHDEQPRQFFVDIEALFSTSQLKRIYGGIEYTVPISSSWGVGDLKKPILVSLDPKAKPLWESPSLILAFVAIDLIPSSLSLLQKTKKCREILLKLPFFQAEASHFQICTCEKIIRHALFQQLELSEEDLEDYENRPPKLMLGNLSRPGASQKLEHKCLQFYKTFQEASKTFRRLADNALLKSWEFTLASFSEVKASFGKWNLYSSLGFAPDDEGGIGEFLFVNLKKGLAEANAIVEEQQEVADGIYAQLKYLESRFKRAGSEEEARSLKMQLQNRNHDLNSIQEIRNKAHRKAHAFANLFNPLIDAYMSKFPLYFQEIYDAEMHDVSSGPYDDSPAGFRLIYKGGRKATGQWSAITNPSEFIDALSGFFILSESDICHLPDFEGIEEELASLISGIISHVKTPFFLETAFNRMAKAHNVRPVKDPLKNLDRIEKKPWVYTSGGTMDNLVACYFNREEKPKEIERWVENEEELLAFFIDSIKQLPEKMLSEYAEYPGKSFLIHSPTHAFLFKPGMPLFREAWSSKEYTYKWIKQEFLLPRESLIQQIVLDDRMMRSIIVKLSKIVPEQFQQHFIHLCSSLPSRLHCVKFRKLLAEVIGKHRRHFFGMISEEDIDAVLYSMLPLFPAHEFLKHAERVFREMDHFSSQELENLLETYTELNSSTYGLDLLGAKDLAEKCLALIMLTKQETSSEYPYYTMVYEAMRRLSLVMPAPLLFADSNWVKHYFGLVVGPGSGKLELWRFNLQGTEGVPMADWKQWVDGSRRDRTWGIFTNPYEYVSVH
jgi:hypothetical protein